MKKGVQLQPVSGFTSNEIRSLKSAARKKGKSVASLVRQAVRAALNGDSNGSPSAKLPAVSGQAIYENLCAKRYRDPAALAADLRKAGMTQDEAERFSREAHDYCNNFVLQAVDQLFLGILGSPLHESIKARLLELAETDRLVAEQPEPASCPNCDEPIDVEGVSEDDEVTCDGCGTTYDILAVDPLELEEADEETEEDEESDEEEEPGSDNGGKGGTQ
jgi:alpha-aminoadipate/glutamate carrier protein LysW